MKKSEELQFFLEKADELACSKYILSEIKIVNLLKAISASETLLAIFKNCLINFDIEEAKKKYFVKSKYLTGDKGEFILPNNSRELLALVFNVLVEIDAKQINFPEFLSKYFYEDGSFSASYSAFINSMIKPFRNSVKVLMECVIDGSLEDPIDAIVREEERRAGLEIERQKREKLEAELMKKSYGASVKKIKEYLLSDKQKVKNSKLKDQVKEELTLIIDMLANVIESEDKDAIYYAFVSYKYCTKAHKIMFRARVRKIKKLLKDVLCEF